MSKALLMLYAIFICGFIVFFSLSMEKVLSSSYKKRHFDNSYINLNYHRIALSTASISGWNILKQTEDRLGSGTIVQMGDGNPYIFTSAHMFQTVPVDIKKISFKVNDKNNYNDMNEGKLEMVYLANRSNWHDHDIAILKIKESKRKLHPCIMSFGVPPKIGTRVVSSGHPLLENFHPLFSSGIISRHIKDDDKLITVTDAKVHFGSSGGGIYEVDIDESFQKKPVCLGIVAFFRKEWTFFVSGYHIRNWMVKNHPDIWNQMNKRAAR